MVREWQPIETAPKDRPILLFLRGYPPKARWAVGEWRKTHQEWWDEYGWTLDKYLPSHWMDPGSPDDAANEKSE